jgi:DNA-binding IclR family transcriptional regulator
MAIVGTNQRHILRCLSSLTKACGYPPTVAMLARRAGKSRNAIMFQLDRLVAAGYVRHAYGERQGWTLTPEGMRLTEAA